jgi:hypothetical protein
VGYSWLRNKVMGILCFAFYLLPCSLNSSVYITGLLRPRYLSRP